MTRISLQKTQAELGDFLIRAEAGEEIVIEREDLPALRLAVTSEAEESSGGFARRDRRRGAVSGYGSFAHLRGKIPDDFFDSLPEDELKLWEGGD